MRLNNAIVSIIVLVFFAGGIGAAMAFNAWEVKPGQAVATSRDGTPVVAYKPADIQGTYSFGEISQMFNIPLHELGTAFELNSVANLADFKARQLKTVYPDLGKGIMLETESVRIFVALYKGMPHPLSETAFLPNSAVKILKDKARLSPEQIAFLDAHSIDVRGR